MDEYTAPILPSRDLEETLAFYERLGATPVETGMVGIGGHRYEQVAYAWRDLHLLIARDAGAV